MAIRPLHNESELLSNVSKGDRQAFALLFDAYYKNLGNYVLKITESREATEEIIQDTFMTVWEKRSELTGLRSFTGYLFILSKNRTLNYLKKKARELENQNVWCRNFIEESYRIDEKSPDEEYELIIDHALTLLSPQQQKVYQLSRYEHLKYEEIALTLGLSKETVKKHMQLALKQLKQIVKNSIARNAMIMLILSQLFLFLFILLYPFLHFPLSLY